VLDEMIVVLSHELSIPRAADEINHIVTHITWSLLLTSRGSTHLHNKYFASI